MKLKSSFVILLALILALAAGVFHPGSEVNAQSSAPHMTVTAAYSGYFKYGEWLPVWVELENQGADLDGEVRVEVTSSQGMIVYSVPISLPSGSHKLTVVYVLPNNFSRELVVKLVSQGETLSTGKTSVSPQANITFFTGLVASQRGALSLISGVKLLGQERSKIMVDLKLNELPDRAEALRSFDLLVFNDADTSKLTAGQKEALAGWVRQGGHLVIGGGAGAQRTLAGMPDSISPVAVNAVGELPGKEAAPLAEYAQAEAILAPGPFVYARGSLLGNSQVIAGAEDAPLVVQRTLGSGMVHFVSLDLAAAPFNGWAGAQSFWETIIGPAGSYPENMPFDVSLRQYRANSLYYALSNIPSLDLPSVKGIIILLVIYILVIGPLNYLILRRIRRLHLAWVTMPAITAIFSVGTFGMGYAMRGNDLVLNKIALVQVGAEGDANVTSYMGLFSPRQQAYEITVEGESLLSPMTGYDYDPWSSGSPNTSGGEMVFVQGQPARLRGLTVNQWAMQSFMSEGTWKNFGNLDGEFTLKNDNLVGTVRNGSQYSLSDVVVVMNNRFQRLGDMAAGEEKEVDLGLSSLQSDRFGPSLSYRLYQENLNSNTPLTRAAEQKMNIISSVLENGPWMKSFSSSSIPSGTGAYNGGVFLLGWLDQAPPEVSIAGNVLTYRTTTLVYRGVEYHLPDSGLLTIPAGLVPGAIIKYPVGSGNCGTSTSLNMGPGEAELEFQVPENLAKLQVTALKVAISMDIGGVGVLPKIALYDWQNASWTEIQDPIQGTNIIQNAAPYLSEGKIHLRLTGESNNFSCIYIDVGLDAEQAELQGGAQ